MQRLLGSKEVDGDGLCVFFCLFSYDKSENLYICVWHMGLGI